MPAPNSTINLNGTTTKNEPQVVRQPINTNNAGFVSKDRSTDSKGANAVLGTGVNDKAVLFSQGELISLIEAKLASSGIDYAAFSRTPGLIDPINTVNNQNTKINADEPTSDKKRLNQIQAQGLIKQRDIVKVSSNVKGKVIPRGQIPTLNFSDGDILSSADKEDNETSRKALNVLNLFPRYFEDRSFLIFVQGTRKIVMPFFENPIIEEKRLVEYSTMGNVGGALPLLLYKFTQLTDIKISFKISYKHIAHIMSNEGLENNSLLFQGSLADQESLADVKKFFERTVTPQSNSNTPYPLLAKRTFLEEEKQTYISKFAKRNFSLANNDFLEYGDIMSGDSAIFKKSQELTLLFLDTIKQWLFSNGADIARQVEQLPKEIKDSIERGLEEKINNPASSRNTPKFVILKHGPVFHFIPCVLMNYTIKETQNTTYDIKTLLADSYDVNLSLFGLSNQSVSELIFKPIKITSAPASTGSTQTDSPEAGAVPAQTRFEEARNASESRENPIIRGRAPGVPIRN